MNSFVYSFIISSLLILFSSFPSSAQGIFVPDQSLVSKSFTLTPSQKAVKTSTDVILIALPVATLTGVVIMKDWEGLKEGAFTALATAGATYLLKWTVRERRPDGSSFDSFPSGHTATSFATATFLLKRYGWKIAVPAYALSCYVGWGRCFAQRHNWWDVLAGAAIGSASAWIFTTPFAKKHNLAVTPHSDGRNIALHTSFTF